MGQKYFETKDGSLEAVSTKIAKDRLNLFMCNLAFFHSQRALAFCHMAFYK